MRPNREFVTSHPATRVLTVLEMLQTHGRLSGAELAERLEVDRRTVRRYIALLEEIGIPITTGRGPLGGYELVAGYKLPPMMFTHDEALALSLGLAAARGLGLTAESQAIAGAQAKLERVMPAKLKGRVRAVNETVSFAPVSDSDRSGGAALAGLSSGAHSRQGVHLRYRAPSGEESARDFDPYGLAFHGGHWYAVGHCHLRQALRSFRLDRVVEVIPQARSFQRPAKFDVISHLAESIAMLPRKFAVEVMLKTTIEAAKREIQPAIGVMEARGESVLLRSQTDDLDWFARELARLPFRFEIRRPAELQAALVRHARRLMRRR